MSTAPTQASERIFDTSGAFREWLAPALANQSELFWFMGCAAVVVAVLSIFQIKRSRRKLITFLCSLALVALLTAPWFVIPLVLALYDAVMNWLAGWV